MAFEELTELTATQKRKQDERFLFVIRCIKNIISQLDGETSNHEFILARAIVRKLIEAERQRQQENVPDYWLLRQG